jgi:hypothetical protein
MAQDRSGGADLSAAERAAAARVARKRLGADGCPEPAPDPPAAGRTGGEAQGARRPPPRTGRE